MRAVEIYFPRCGMTAVGCLAFLPNLGRAPARLFFGRRSASGTCHSTGVYGYSRFFRNAGEHFRLKVCRCAVLAALDERKGPLRSEWPSGGKVRDAISVGVTVVEQP